MQPDHVCNKLCKRYVVTHLISSTQVVLLNPLWKLLFYYYFNVHEQAANCGIQEHTYLHSHCIYYLMESCGLFAKYEKVTILFIEDNKTSILGRKWKSDTYTLFECDIW